MTFVPSPPWARVPNCCQAATKFRRCLNATTGRTLQSRGQWLWSVQSKTRGDNYRFLYGACLIPRLHSFLSCARSWHIHPSKTLHFSQRRFVFHQLIPVFQIEVQNIEEPGKQALEVLFVRLIGGQGRLKGSFRLRDETVTVYLQSLFRSLCAHILLLHFRKHALRFSVQLLPCALLVLFRFGPCRALAAPVRQAQTKARHVVVPELTRGVFVRVAHIEVRAELFVRQFDLGVLLPNGGLL